MQLFSTNEGGVYIPNKIEFTNDKASRDSTLATSCVKDDKIGDIIVKIVNVDPNPAPANISLADFGVSESKASVKFLTGSPADKNTLAQPGNIVPVSTSPPLADIQKYVAPAYSLTIVRFRPGGH